MLTISHEKQENPIQALGWVTALILSLILLSVLNSYIDGIVWDNQCGFRCNVSTTDNILSIYQVLEKMRIQWSSH
jgi:hypothetical protein